MDLVKQDKTKLISSIKAIFTIAMIGLLAIIAIILVSMYKIEIEKLEAENDNYIQVASKEIGFVKSTDEELISFINEYFKARENEDYEKIFSDFNLKLDKNNLSESDEQKIKNIIYERSFVKAYKNIDILTINGMKDNEILALLTYDVEFSFSDDLAPSILLCYIVKDSGKYYFKEHFDIGTTKFINEVIENDEVKKIYSEVKARLEIALTGNEELKLAYNSLRQNVMSNKDDIEISFDN